MKQNIDILKKAARKTGYTVPDNYFENVRTKIMNNIPEYAEHEEPKNTTWQRIQPYIYMAAMFAGIWCMMKVIHMSGLTDLNLDNPPAEISLAMADADHYEWMDVTEGNIESFILEDDMSTQYSSIEEFEEDFNNTSM